MRLTPAAQVRAECAERAARIDGHFDGVTEQLQAAHTQFAADGYIRPATTRTRAGDPPRACA